MMHHSKMNNVRQLVLLLLLASSIAKYINRTNLNIAIVPMTTPFVAPATSRLPNETTATHYGCPPKKSFNSHPQAVAAVEQKHYNWDQVTQGKILGASFYSYAIFMIPAGRLAERLGSRWVIFASLLVPALAAVLVPFVTDYHFSILMSSRFLLGIFQSGFYPAAYAMVCNWFPVKERSFGFAVVELGAAAGCVLTYAASGAIINNMGWPSMFFIPGSIALVVSLLFLIVTRNKPDQHPLISEEEVKVIRMSGSEENTEQMKNLSAPWCMMLTNASVLSTLLFKFAIVSCTSLIYLELPKYLSEVVHENISDNGSINAFIYLMCVISMLSCGALSERIIQKGWIGRTTTRKTFSIFVGTMSAICLALVPVAGCETFYLYILLCMFSFFTGFYTGSDVPIVSEMTVHFPATLYALFNMVAMSSGFVVPYFTGRVLDSFDDPTAGWPIVFYSCAGLSVFANVVFILFAKAERQDFDMICDAEHVVLFTTSGNQRRNSLYI